MTERRRQILFLIPSLRGGGAERVMVTLLRHLDRSKFNLALAVIDLSGAAYQRDLPEDVELIDLACSRLRFALPGIIRLIWRRRPDVVFSTLSHLNVALAICRPLLPNETRYVARETIIVSELLKTEKCAHIWRWAFRRFYDRFDRVVCQSRDMHDDLVEHFALSPEKAILIYNPVDIERIQGLAAMPCLTGMQGGSSQVRNHHINLVAAGRLSAQKGFDILIEALAICNDPRLHLTLLGEGPLRIELERLSRDKGVIQQIRFLGFQNNPYPFFAQADAFVLSSRYEGLPNVILEALACGTPIISTPAPGGVKEILQGLEECVLSRSMSSSALAQAIMGMTFGRRVSLAALEPYEVKKIVGRYESEIFADHII